MSYTPSTGAWVHYAITRDSSFDTRIYADGSLLATQNITNVVPTTTLVIGGRNGAATFGWDGFMDDLRITNDYARYTGASYTVPTGPLSP